jgi:hypothetical protein
MSSGRLMVCVVGSERARSATARLIDDEQAVRPRVKVERLERSEDERP